MASDISSSPSITSQEREPPTTDNVDIESIKKTLFKKAMSGLWEEVVTDYKNPTAQEIKITRSGDTLLHVAVFDGQGETVRKLVDQISKENESKILKIKNNRGNTPLHLAAALGDVEMCKRMAEKEPRLIGERNGDGETPLFLAALHGRKEAFLCLHFYSQKNEEDYYSYCRRNDGDTILHCAISGEYFDLAFQIIRKYEDLVNYNNEKGFSPLHLLALNPSNFKSGSHLTTFELIIYYCIIVEQLTEETNYNSAYRLNSSGEENGCFVDYPKNYTTCLTFFEILRKLISVIVISASGKKNSKTTSRDEENPQHVKQKSTRTSGADGGRGTEESDQSKMKNSAHKLYPPNYTTCFNFFELIMKALLVVLGLGFTRVRKIKQKREKHTWAYQVMEELLGRTSIWECDNKGGDPWKQDDADETTTFDYRPLPPQDDLTQPSLNDDHTQPSTKAKDRKPIWDATEETPLLTAAKMGIIEMVEKILDRYPMAIQDINSDKKNVVLLAVENRQPHVYQLLQKRKILMETVFRRLDNKGNSTLHLAATLGEYRPCLIPGAALQMQWEIRWYKFVKESMPRDFFVRHNDKGQTPKQVFTETHRDLVKEGGAWLTNTSESCSVVAALIATVAFATAATVPGGTNNSGEPNLVQKPAFYIFAISSLVALCFSITSVIMFLTILTSRYQEQDFASDLPKKLIVGLSSLFISIASMLVSFCAGHFFILKSEMRFAAYPLYAATCLPVAFFAAAQFPLYFDLIRATFRKVPQRSYKAITTT